MRAITAALAAILCLLLVVPVLADEDENAALKKELAEIGAILKKRFKTLRALKDQGKVGDTFSGTVEAVKESYLSEKAVGDKTIKVFLEEGNKYRSRAYDILAKLNEIVRMAKERYLPICVGTEMNNAAQPLVDHFDVAELKPHIETFLAGAQIIGGHALLLRHGGFGYLSPQSEVVFGKDTLRKNGFFREVGARPVPHGSALKALREASRNGDERGVLRALPKM